MHAVIIEALPAAAERPFAVAFEIELAVVIDVVLAGDKKSFRRLGLAKDLIARVELLLFRTVRQVARVQQQGRRGPSALIRATVWRRVPATSLLGARKNRCGCR